MGGQYQAVQDQYQSQQLFVANPSIFKNVAFKTNTKCSVVSSINMVPKNQNNDAPPKKLGQKIVQRISYNDAPSKAQLQPVVTNDVNPQKYKNFYASKLPLQQPYRTRQSLNENKPRITNKYNNLNLQMFEKARAKSGSRKQQLIQDTIQGDSLYQQVLKEKSQRPLNPKVSPSLKKERQNLFKNLQEMMVQNGSIGTLRCIFDETRSIEIYTNLMDPLDLVKFITGDSVGTSIDHMGFHLHFQQLTDVSLLYHNIHSGKSENVSNLFDEFYHTIDDQKIAKNVMKKYDEEKFKNKQMKNVWIHDFKVRQQSLYSQGNTIETLTKVIQGPRPGDAFARLYKWGILTQILGLDQSKDRRAAICLENILNLEKVLNQNEIPNFDRYKPDLSLELIADQYQGQKEGLTILYFTALLMPLRHQYTKFFEIYKQELKQSKELEYILEILLKLENTHHEMRIHGKKDMIEATVRGFANGSQQGIYDFPREVILYLLQIGDFSDSTLEKIKFPLPTFKTNLDLLYKGRMISDVFRAYHKDEGFKESIKDEISKMYRLIRVSQDEFDEIEARRIIKEKLVERKEYLVQRYYQKSKKVKKEEFIIQHYPQEPDRQEIANMEVKMDQSSEDKAAEIKHKEKKFIETLSKNIQSCQTKEEQYKSFIQMMDLYKQEFINPGCELEKKLIQNQNSLINQLRDNPNQKITKEIKQINQELSKIRSARQLPKPELGRNLQSSQVKECVYVQKIMVYCKPFDQEVIFSFMKLYSYMSEKYPHIEIYVDDWVLEEIRLIKQAEICQGQEVCEIDFLPNIFVNDGEESRQMIDFIVTLGGDGTILWASKQFRRQYFPPLISFAHGSLGYMCNFEFDEYPQVLEQVFSKDNCNLHLDNRLRLSCGVVGDPYKDVFRGNSFQESERIKIQDFHIVNEVVVDRGPSPYSLQLEIYFDGNYMTTLIGDGLIIATPNGSTAYNLSAGGSIVQSNCQCISLTPMAPHSLSFRPLIIPINTTITLKKPLDNRNSAWVSLDGATRFELGEDDEFEIKASDSCISMVVNPSDNLTDLWGQRLVKMLNWNERKQMKPLQKKKIE